MLTPINSATGLVLDFSVDIGDVSHAANISVRAVRTALRKTTKSRYYKWRGKRLRFGRVVTVNLKPTNQFSIRVSSLPDKIQIILIAQLRAELAARLAGHRS